MAGGHKGEWRAGSEERKEARRSQESEYRCRDRVMHKSMESSRVKQEMIKRTSDIGDMMMPVSRLDYRSIAKQTEFGAELCVHIKQLLCW